MKTSKLKEFVAYIFKDNVASLKIFKKAGFVFSGEYKIKKRTVLIYRKKQCKNGEIKNINNNGQEQLDGVL